MSSEQSGKKRPIEEGPCNRCGAENANSVVTIRANYEGSAHSGGRPLCDACLKTLGEWWNDAN